MADNDKLTKEYALAKKAFDFPVQGIELRVEIDSDQQSVKYRLPHVRDRIGEELKWSDVREKLAGIKSAIYIIEQIDENANFKKTHNDFKTYRENENRKEETEKRHCSGLNAPCQGHVLFVGSCTDFRIAQMINLHMGNSSAGTWALHLKFWFKGEIKITIKEYRVILPVLRIIADILANRFKPMFGRRGRENEKPSEKKRKQKKRKKKRKVKKRKGDD